MSDQGPAWGIEPVPERLRVLGFTDQLLLWGNLSVSLLVIVAGALLVPALSVPYALLAIVVAALSGSLLIGLGALLNGHLLHLGTKLGDLHAAVRRHLGLRRKLLSRLVDSAKFLSKTTQLLLNILLNLHDKLGLILGLFGDHFFLLSNINGIMRFNEVVV